MAATATGVGDVCRLTVYGPESSVELAVPAHVPLADLLPTLLGHLDPRLATSGLEHGGWVLQRLGETPFDEDLGTAALGLYDGDIVHLRPRDDQLAPIDFDDRADGIASGISERRDRWRPDYTVQLAYGLAAVVLLAGGFVVASFSSGHLAASVALAVCVVLLLSATAAVRAFADRRVGVMLALFAVGYGWLAGTELPGVRGPLSWHVVTTGPAVLTGAVLTAVAALIARFGTDTMRAGLTSIAAGAGLVAGAAVLDIGTALDAVGVAGLLVPITLLVGYFVPSFAANAVGLRVPALPRNTTEFQDDLEPEASADLLARTATADRYVTALYAALAVVMSAALIIVAADGGVVGPIMVLVVSLVLLLHCRELISAFQRLAMMAPAASAVGGVVVAWVDSHGDGFRAGAALLLLALALGSFALGHAYNRRRIIPHWGLAGDIANWVAAVAVVPMALQVAGVYSMFHGLFR